MLVYERKLKNPIKIKFTDAEIAEKRDYISFKEGEGSQVKKEYDVFRFTEIQQYKDNIKRILSTNFYDVQKNEYYHYVPFYYSNKYIPTDYFIEVTEDNSLFQKHQNTSDEQFVIFFDKVLSVLDETLSNLKNVSVETSNKISSTLLNFIFKILSQKDKNKLLGTAKEKFLHILDLSPHSLKAVFHYLIDNLKLVSEVLLNENPNIVQNHAELLSELIKRVFGKTSSEEEVENFEKAKRILEFVVDLFPRIPGRLVPKIGPILQVNFLTLRCS